MNKLKDLKVRIFGRLGRLFKFGADADRDWRLILVVFFFLVVVFLVIDIFDFFRFAKFKNNDLETKKNFEFVDKKALKNIIDKYDKRALDFEKLRLGQDIR